MFISTYYLDFLGLIYVTHVNFFFILQLERYEVARDTILSGLQIDPFRYGSICVLFLFPVLLPN